MIQKLVEKRAEFGDGAAEVVCVQINRINSN